jgi:hypothetical protein
MSKLIGGLLVVLALGWVGSVNAALMDPVEVNGSEWLQPADFVGYSWGDIATVCDPVTGACNGSLGGDDLAGWTWASLLDIGELFHTTMPNLFPGGISSTFLISNEINSEVNDFFDVWGFEPTFDFVPFLGPYRNAAGYASDGGATIHPYVQATNYFAENITVIDNNGTLPSGTPGAWLFRDTPAGVSIPATIPLLGIALTILGFSRRRTLGN